MRKLSTLTMAGMFLSSAAFADVTIGIPATATTTSAATKTLTGISTYVSNATATSTSLVTLGGDGSVHFTYNVQNGPNAYQGATGLLIPIDPSWNIYDLSSADTIQFDIKTTTAGPELDFMVGSALYEHFQDTDAALQSNTTTYSGYVAKAATGDGIIRPTTAWQTIKIATADLVNSQWDDTDLVAVASNWSAPLAGGYAIGTAVKNFQIQPSWNWGTGGATIGNPTGDYYVRNFVIKHASMYHFNQGTGCSNPVGFQLDRFSSATPTANPVGGYWFAFTDASDTVLTDTAAGASTIQPFNGKKVWGIWNYAGTQLGGLRATLEKDLTTSNFLYHAYAGWADIGTNFGTDGNGANLAPVLTGISAISFNLFLGDPQGGFDSLKFDTTNVPYISLKVGVAGVPDAVAYSIKIPASLKYGSGATICVDLDSLTQPSYYLGSQGFAADAANGISQISWEMKIADQNNSAIHTSGPNTMAINSVKVWGIDSATTVAAIAAVSSTGIKGSANLASAFRASYRQNLVVSFAVGGPSAQVDVLRLDGTRVAGFKTAAVAKNLSLPVTLSHGTYLVSVRGSGKSLAMPLVVAH